MKQLVIFYYTQSIWLHQIQFQPQHFYLKLISLVSKEFKWLIVHRSACHQCQQQIQGDSLSSLAVVNYIRINGFHILVIINFDLSKKINDMKYIFFVLTQSAYNEWHFYSDNPFMTSLYSFEKQVRNQPFALRNQYTIGKQIHPMHKIACS